VRWTISIAYQATGSGPPDLLFVNSAYVSNVDLIWEWPVLAPFLRGLAARGRLMVFDRRGSGLSDSVSGDHLPTLEARMDDIRAVMDAVSSERAILLGLDDGAALCFLFAATHPDRTEALIALNAVSRGSWAPDAPWLETEAGWDRWFEMLETGWGTPEFAQYVASDVFPSLGDDPEFVRDYWRIIRHSITKADALANDRMWEDTDVRHVLPTIQTPTLVLHNPAVRATQGVAEESAYIANRIPGAEFVELDGNQADALWTLPEIDRFIASLRDEAAELDRVLATVLFTDIVDSTQKAADLGDRAWRDLLERHHATVRAMLGRYRGKEIDTAGDGFFATFDGPARGVRCARAIIDAVKRLGLEVRAGLHTGEVETLGENVGGIAVHIGARVGALAVNSEIMVSQTVKDLVAGSGLTFEDAGEHELKGVPDRWHLYRVVS
jgi:class 3 adenylate cyclase